MTGISDDLQAHILAAAALTLAAHEDQDLTDTPAEEAAVLQTDGPANG